MHVLVHAEDLVCTLPGANWGPVTIGTRISSSTLLVDGSLPDMERFGLSVEIWGQVMAVLVGTPPQFPT